MRRFTCHEGTSHKFWEISVDGSTTTVTFGRIGTHGQTKQKPHASPAAALAEMDKLVREKLGKGYVEEQSVTGLTERIKASFADITAWLVEHGAKNIVDDLRAPITPTDLAAQEAALELPLPPALRAAYLLHDGQTTWDPPGQNSFFPHGIGGFLDLASALRIDGRDQFIGPSFDQTLSDAEREAVTAEPLESQPRTDRRIPRSWFFVDDANTKQDLLPEECSTAWLAFAWEENFLGFIHLRTGRIFAWAKDEGLTFLAPSFDAFLVELAADLCEKKRYKLVRDPYADDEPVEDRPWVWTSN